MSRLSAESDEPTIGTTQSSTAKRRRLYMSHGYVVSPAPGLRRPFCTPAPGHGSGAGLITWRSIVWTGSRRAAFEPRARQIVERPHADPISTIAPSAGP